MLRRTVLLLTVSTLLPFASAGASLLPPVQVAEDVDLERYGGLWYEIARTPNPFQLGCVCTTAHYSLETESSIDIINACNNFFARGSLRSIEGSGVVVDPTETNAKLEIGFFDDAPPADYWIIEVLEDPDDPDGPYRFAAVGGSNREFIFILARTPRPWSMADRAALDQIRERLAQQLFPTWALSPTLHTSRCRYEDRTP